MFGWKKKVSDGNPPDHGLFERAKEATRRATFLVGSTMHTANKEGQQQLRMLFQVCCSTAVSTGAALGRSEAGVDAAISAWTDADAAHFKTASDDEIRKFAAKSGEIVKAFLARDAMLDP